jgi:hypothetical protein
VGSRTLRLLRKIEKNADENFSAAAWILERRFPESFSRPEIQLGLTINQTMNNNVLVISVEQAEGLRKRNASLNKELDTLSEAYEAKQKLMSGTGASDQVREVESAASSLVSNSGAIALPPPAGRSKGWWALLASGDGSRAISVEAADYVIAEVLGSARASGVKVDCGEEGVPTLRDVWETLEKACGPSGWAALVKRGSGHPQDGPAGATGRVASA